MATFRPNDRVICRQGGDTLFGVVLYVKANGLVVADWSYRPDGSGVRFQQGRNRHFIEHRLDR